LSEHFKVYYVLKKNQVSF